MRLPGRRRSASAARDFAGRTTTEWQLAVDQDVVVLLVSELVTNALLHAGTDFDVTLAYEHGVLRVSVHDQASALPLPRVHSHDALSTGRGLMLVEALARRWGVEQDDSGKTVWFELDADLG